MMTWPPTSKQHAAMTEYVRDMAQRLGLGHWRCEVAQPYEHGPDDDDSEAQTFVATYTDRFEVFLYEPFWSMTPEEQRRTVVHELMHPHLDRAWTDVLDAAADGIGGTATEALRVRTRHEVERAIERIAWAIAEHFPLP